MIESLKKETVNSKSFLTYEISDKDRIDQLSVEMLKNNKIPHILPVTYTQIGNERFLKYEITSYITLQDIIKYPVSKERLLKIFEGVFDGILNLEDYMIPDTSVLMSLDEIYFDEYNDYVQLLCFPINIDTDNVLNLEEFIRKIVNCVQLKTNDEFITGKILNKLNQTQVFSAQEFKKFINLLLNEKNQPSNVIPPVEKKKEEPPKAVNKPQQVPIQKNVIQNQRTYNNNREINIPQKQPASELKKEIVQNQNYEKKADSEPAISLFYLLQHYNAENAELYKRQKAAKKGKSNKQKKKNDNTSAMNIPGMSNVPPQTIQNTRNEYVEHREPQKRNFGNTTVLNAKPSKKTTVLSNQTVPGVHAQKQTIITRNKTGERIIINTNPFKIGANEEGSVNFCVKGNTNISQEHIVVLFKDNSYYIIDNGSTNGTYINANRILPGKEVRLNNGDYIRLADEDFRFEII